MNKKKSWKVFIGGLVIGGLAGLIAGGFTMAVIMGSVVYKLSTAKPVCNLSGQVITK